MLQEFFTFDIKKYPAIYVLLVAFFINLFINSVQADNTTQAYRKLPNFVKEKNQPRFLSFNTEDDGDLSVELEFAVPFLSIPVKKSVESAMGFIHGTGGAVANINVGALILGGALIFGMVVVIPLLSSFVFKKNFFSASKGHERSTEENETWRIMALIDQALIEHNIDTTSCMQRTVCWLSKSARTNLNNGEASSQDKIIDGLATNYWVNQLIDGSAIQTAIQSGIENKNCSKEYDSCKISQQSLQKFAWQFAKYLQYNK